MIISGLTDIPRENLHKKSTDISKVDLIYRSFSGKKRLPRTPGPHSSTRHYHGMLTYPGSNQDGPQLAKTGCCSPRQDWNPPMSPHPRAQDHRPQYFGLPTHIYGIHLPIPRKAQHRRPGEQGRGIEIPLELFGPLRLPCLRVNCLNHPPVRKNKESLSVRNRGRHVRRVLLELPKQLGELPS